MSRAFFAVYRLSLGRTSKCHYLGAGTLMGAILLITVLFQAIEGEYQPPGMLPWHSDARGDDNSCAADSRRHGPRADSGIIIRITYPRQVSYLYKTMT